MELTNLAVERFRHRLIITWGILLLFSCQTNEKARPAPSIPGERTTLRELARKVERLDKTATRAYVEELFKSTNYLNPVPNPEQLAAIQMKLADSAFYLAGEVEWRIDSLALEIYDSVYSQTIHAREKSTREFARTCCYKIARLMKSWGKQSQAQAALEKYFMQEPVKTDLESMQDIYAAGSLGDYYLQLGDYNKSKYYYSKSFWANYKLPPDSQFGGCYSDMINYYNIEKLYDSVGWFQRKIGDSIQWLSERGLKLPPHKYNYHPYILANYALALSGLHQHGQAESLALAAIKIVSDSGGYESERFKMIGGYADILTSASRFSDARVQYQKAISAVLPFKDENDPRDISKLYKSLGDNYMQAGSRDSALVCYHNALACVVKIDTGRFALPVKKDLYTENSIQEALDAMADWWLGSADSKKIENALQASELAMQVDDLLQQQFSFEVPKLDYQLQKKKRSSLAIALCFRLFQKDRNEQWAKKALEFSEAAKAALLLDNIKREITSRQNNSDSLVRQLKWVENDMASLKSNMFQESGNPTELTVLRKEYNAAEAEYVMLTTELQHRNPLYDKLKRNPVKTDYLSDPLLAGLPVAEFFAVSGDSYYIVYRDDSGHFKLDSCLLPASLLNNWILMLSNPDTCNRYPVLVKQQGNLLYRMLFKANLNTRDTRLVIIPDGNLWKLPWDALVTSPDTTESYRQTAFMVKSKTVMLGFSMESLVLQNKREQLPAASKIVGFAPGIFPADNRHLQPLPASSTELKAIAATEPGGHYFYGASANKENFEKNAGSGDVLHVSTHAFAGSEEQCVLQLYDGPLYLHDLYQQNINAKLVVLSACKTAIGEFKDGEGVYSMNRSFYFAGAKNVITSLWNVDDEKTADLFKQFYGEDAEPAERLHLAKMKFLEDHSETYSSPYYWAAFYNTGFTVPVATTPNAWIAAGITIIFLLLVLGLGTRQVEKVRTAI